MTDRTNKTVRALGICSGGLDSILSGLVLRQQGIHVEWVCFETPFFSADKAREASRMTGIALHVQDITDDYLKMLEAPPAGYGKNMNPCMDCHALMFQKAGKMMDANGFDFLFSGEVAGQRPFSQNKNSLHYVAKHSTYRDRILRPLSAQRLPETPMETSGLVDRAQLLDFSGRSRKPQMALAKQFGISKYPAPAGGCLLTDVGYSRRLRDLFDHQEILTPNALHLLKYGRHMRLNPTTKIIVGRTQKDNENILRHVDPHTDALIKITAHPGPTAVLPGGGSDEIQFLAGAICAGYSKAPEDASVTVRVSIDGKVNQINVLPIQPHEAKRFLIK